MIYLGGLVASTCGTLQKGDHAFSGRHQVLLLMDQVMEKFNKDTVSRVLITMENVSYTKSARIKVLIVMKTMFCMMDL